jgi:Flp pilus assembly protein TadG
MIQMVHREIPTLRFQYSTDDFNRMRNHFRKSLRRLHGRQDGNAMIELAVVLPVLLLLFVGAAEVGRMFYTYTTLAKATKLGARYLSTSKLASSGSTTDRAFATSQAQNLVVCGYVDCTGHTAIAPGLASANVAVTLPTIGANVSYVRVQIQNYPFTTGAFNLALRLGVTNATIYNATSLTPGTTMRYMP